jgi:hypothetical protein
MKVSASIGWEATWLQNAVEYCCDEVEYPFGQISAATFTRCHNAPFRGRSCHRDRSIRVKINPVNVYPLVRREPKSLLLIAVMDAVELLVLATAREVADLERREWRVQTFGPPDKRDGKRGREKERVARRVLDRFRLRRSEVLHSWGGDPGPGPVAPAAVHRMTCRTCGRQRAFAARPVRPTRRYCKPCLTRRPKADVEDLILAYDHVPYTEWSKPAAVNPDDENDLALYSLFSNGMITA